VTGRGDAALLWARQARRRAEIVRAEAEAARRRAGATTDTIRADRRRALERESDRVTGNSPQER